MTFFFSHSRCSKRSTRQRRTIRHDLESLDERSLLSAGYLQTNLVGYQAGMARTTDANLNGWGIASAPGGPFCVANNSTGTATFYRADGSALPLVITIPPAPGQPFGPVGSPTGVVYNATSDFVISAHGRSAPARFIFDTFDGLICGWNPSVDATHAIIMVNNSAGAPFPALYTGLDLTRNSHGENVLYAVDNGLTATTTNNRIDMFDGHLHSLGSFTDPSLNPQTDGTVFQAEDINHKLYVTYTGFAAPFGGGVDVFDTEGHLLTPHHFASNAPLQGPLNAPWAMVLAPHDFGKFSDDLLVGNVEDGRINAFDPRTGKFLGSMQQPDGKPIVIPGLWDMSFGDGSPNNGKTHQLFFSAGFTAENPAGNGLFGEIVAGREGGNQPEGISLSARQVRTVDERRAGPPAW